MEPIIETVHSDANVIDWRLIEYGKGKGYIAAAVRRALAEGSVPSVLLVPNFASDAAKEALAVLLPAATEIWQAI
jgi:hypothetical protein